MTASTLTTGKLLQTNCKGKQSTEIWLRSTILVLADIHQKSVLMFFCNIMNLNPENLKCNQNLFLKPFQQKKLPFRPAVGMSLHEQSSRYHVEVLTKLKLLKVFIWCKATDKPRIGCKKDEIKNELVLVLFQDRTGSIEQIPIKIMPSISVDISTSQIVVREDLTTCSFAIQFKDDFSRYIWQYGQENADILSLDDLECLSCYHCSQPILRQPLKIEKYETCFSLLIISFIA